MKKSNQDMKRIVFALCAISIALSTMAQGTLQKRLQGNPKVDNLVNEVTALSGNPDVSYYFDGKSHKTVGIFCNLMNDFQPTPPTGDSKKDAQNHVMDSIRQDRINQGRKVYEAIRNTCKALTDKATESYSWEYHRDGVDSVRYTIAIGEYQNGDTMTIYHNQRDVQYYNAPELLSFYYNAFAHNDGNPWGAKGYGYFRYEYTPDSVFMPKKDIVPFDKDAYMKEILPILNQKGITSRQFYVYNDSTFTIVRKDRKEDDFVLREQTNEPMQTKSETRGTVYTLHSKAQAYAVLEQIVKATWDYLEGNSGFWYSFHPYNDYGNWKLNELFESKYLTRIPSFFHIYLHSFGEEFNIMIVEGQGDMMIPAEWAVVKSWKNGKVTYDKKALKTLTPQQAREKTSGFTLVTTRQFEPF
jgi:hypothetical protein